MNIPLCKGKNIFPVLVVVFAAILLSLHLGDDCDPSVSSSAGIDFDGPSKTHNARNLVLYGEWLTHDWTPFVHSPLHTLLLVPFFSLMGVGLIHMRLYTVLFSCLALWILYLVVRREHGGMIATIIALLCAVNVDFIMYGRSGLLEPGVLFFMMLSVWLFQRGYSTAEKDDSQLSIYIWFALASLVAFAAIMYKMVAIPFVLAMIFGLVLFPPKKKSSIAAFIIVFLISISLYVFVFMPHFEQFYERESGYWLERAGNMDFFKAWVELKPLQIFLCAIVLAVILFGLRLLFGDVLADKWFGMRSRRKKWIMGALGILLLGLYLKPNLESYIDWIEHPKSNMLKFSRMLGDKYKGMKIAGISPHFAVMENRYEAIKVTPYHLNWHVLSNGIATHLLVPTDFHHLEWFRNKFPDLMENAVYIDSITIGKFHHSLYALGLEALESRVDKLDGSISLFNPDAHTPYMGAIVQLAASGKIMRCEEIGLAPDAKISLRGAKNGS